MKKSTILSYLFTFLFASFVTIIYIWGIGVFSASDKEFIFKHLCNGFFISGVVVAGFGLLLLVSNGGVFDMLAFGVMSLFNAMRKDPKNRKYNDFYEYRKAKKENKRSFFYLIAVGIFFILVAVVFMVLWQKEYDLQENASRQFAQFIKQVVV